jgi:hypothetical protein
MCRFDAICCRKYHSGVRNVDFAIVIQVVHAAIAIVVDENVRRIAIHMAAERGAASGIAT